MTAIIPVLCVLVTVFALELMSLNALKRLTYHCEINMSLTEPGEVAALTYRVTNTSPWPIMFVGFSFLFHDMVEVRESETWQKRHGTQSFLSSLFGGELFLMPHRSFKGTISFSLKKRGVYPNLGQIYLEAGDFLGFKSSVMSYDLGLGMVCTAKLSDQEADMRVIGGLLGEIFVRRFICDDPSLVIGYREYSGREPLKDISWVQTAKLNSLMVKNHDFTTDCDVIVLVDIEPTEANIAERCLSLVRTVCEYLEADRIPYAIRSNGDLFETDRGIGRKHLFEIHRRIGVSRFTKYRDFTELVNRSVQSRHGNHGLIAILPQHDLWIEAMITQVGVRTNTATSVLVSEEDPS